MFFFAHLIYIPTQCNIETEDILQQEYFNSTWQLEGNDDYATVDTNVVLSKDTQNHKFCVSDEWATSDQSEIVTIYQNLFYSNIGLVSLLLFISAIKFFRKFFFKNYQVRLKGNTWRNRMNMIHHSPCAYLDCTSNSFILFSIYL